MPLGLGKNQHPTTTPFSAFTAIFPTKAKEFIYHIPLVLSLAITAHSLLTLEVDICYNLRYFELNGRQPSNPWSCRQSAVHQKYFISDGYSAWTVIHPSESFRARLSSAYTTSSSHPMQFHISYIRSSLRFWRDYLNYQNAQLRRIVCI